MLRKESGAWLDIYFQRTINHTHAVQSTIPIPPWNSDNPWKLKLVFAPKFGKEKVFQLQPFLVYEKWNVSGSWWLGHTAQFFLHENVIIPSDEVQIFFQLMNGWLWKRLVKYITDPWMVWGKLSLKLTFSHLKIACWKMKFPLKIVPFQGIC